RQDLERHAREWRRLAVDVEHRFARREAQDAVPRAAADVAGFRRTESRPLSRRHRLYECRGGAGKSIGGVGGACRNRTYRPPCEAQTVLKTGQATRPNPLPRTATL